MSAIAESSALIDSFKMRAEAVGAQVERVADKQEALTLIASRLRKLGVAGKPHCGALWAAGSFVDDAEAKKLEQSVPGLTFAVTRELAADALVGISQMDWAIADTGTVVQGADDVAKRLVSTLPATHIALVATNSLLPDLSAVFARIDPLKSAYLSFITGPSRTADIERVLTIGVHGPEQLIVILVDDLEVAA